MPALPSAPIPDVLAQLGPLDADTVADLRPYLDTIGDPCSPRGCWYSLTCILLICACAAISGAKSIDEFAEWGQRAHAAILRTLGIRPHPLTWRCSPSSPIIDRVLDDIDGHALDAYLAAQHKSTTSKTGTGTGTGEDPTVPRMSAIVLDGKALKGSDRLGQRRRHLLSACHPRPS